MRARICGALWIGSWLAAGPIASAQNRAPVSMGTAVGARAQSAGRLGGGRGPSYSRGANGTGLSPLGRGSLFGGIGARSRLGGFPTTSTGSLGRAGAGNLTFGHAIARSLEVHSADDVHREGEHGVFDAQLAPNALVSEAIERATAGGPGVETTPAGGRTFVTVDMGRRVGFVGGQAGARVGNPAAQHVRVVLQNGVAISAQPVRISRPTPSALDTASLPPSRRLFSTPFARLTPRIGTVPRGIAPNGAATVALRSGARRVDAVIFDLDGTLADTRQDIAYGIEQGLRDIGVSLPPERIAPLVDGSGLEGIYARAVPNGNPEQRQRFVEGYLRHYNTNPNPRTALYPGVRQMLSSLRAANPNLHFAVATARQPPQAAALLRRLGILDQFSVVSGSGGTALPDKPAPDLLLAVSDHLGVPPANVLMVGDAPTDVTAAQRAGMMSTAVRWGMGRPDALQATHPDFNLPGLNALPSVLGRAPGVPPSATPTSAPRWRQH